MKTINLKELLDELNQELNLSKSKFFENCINERLNKSLKNYYEQLSKAFEHCEIYNNKHNLKMMKKLNKG